MIKRSTTAAFFVTGLIVLICFGASAGPEAGQKKPPQNNLVYEIFVRSFFYDGPENGKERAKKIGNLKGIVKKLDAYLNDGDPKTDHDLEVGVLWLMPIFPSPSYHGYDVTDFRTINPQYGNLDDFKTLLKEAHRRGVRIILDVPFNHTSNQHPWFVQAIKDKDSPFRAFYQIQPDNGALPNFWHAATGANGEKLRYFGLFSSQMPDLDFNNPKVKDEIKAIAKFWLDMGVDGFRLDAAKHIFGDSFDLNEKDILRNNDWWLEFSQFVYQQKPEAILVGEVLGDREMLRRFSYSLDGLVDQPFMYEVRNQVNRSQPGFMGRYKGFLTQARELNLKAFDPKLGFPDQPFQPFGFVASHDESSRLASKLEQFRAQGMQRGVDEAYRLAMYMLTTIPARPIVYQGDEVMQRGWKWNGNPTNDPNPGDGSGVFDETLREPFPWYQKGSGPGQTTWFASRFDRPDDGVSQEEQQKEGGMLHLMRGLTHLRARHPILANGDVGDILSDSQDWMVFEKVAGKTRYLVLMNLTASGNDYFFRKNWYPQYMGAQLIFWSDGGMKRWQDNTADAKNIQDSVFVPPSGLVVLRQAAN